MGKRYNAEQFGPRPDWILCIQLVALGPVALMHLLSAAFRWSSEFIEGLTVDRAWTGPFLNASEWVERRWYQRQIQKMEQPE